jgi:uncharacterized protein YjdB
MKWLLVVGALATMACEMPLANKAAGLLASLQLSPRTLTLRTGQTTQFMVVGLTATGDTVLVGVRWTATGGTIVDTSTTGGKHYVHYRAPDQPGQVRVITQAAMGGLSDTAVVDVSAVPVMSVSVNPHPVSVPIGQTVQLTTTLYDSTGATLSGRVVTWGSSNVGVATINGSGVVTGVTTGSATITATSEGKSGTTPVTVTPAPVASVTVNPTPVSLVVGQTVQLTATAFDAGGNVLLARVVTWGSSSAGVASVDGSGLLTALAAGAATITGTSEGKSATAAVTVTSTPSPVASVSVSPASAAVSVGQTVQLTATPRDAGGNVLVGRVVTWVSGNPAVATVNGSGVVTGVGMGTATITATSEGQSGSATVSVTVPVASVSMSPASASVTVGQTVQLVATPRDGSGNPLTGRQIAWTSSNPALALVNGNGLVTAVAAGAVTISATSEGKSGTAAVTVTPAPVASVTVSPVSPSVGVGQTQQLTATLRDASGNLLTGRAITWTTSNAAVATVSGTGLVTGVAVGTVTITATSEGQSGMATVTVVTVSSTWPHEPAGQATISDYGFSTLNDSGWANLYPVDLTNGHLKVTSDPTAPRSPSSVAQFYYKQGDASQCGTAPATLELDFSTVSTLYIGTWAKFSSGFNFPGGTPGSEVHFLYGNPQTNAWVTVDLRQDGGVELVAAGGTDLYSNAGYFSTGAWTLVELVMDYNTNTARLWINNQAVVFNGSSTIPVGYSGGAFHKVQVTPTWGGCVGSVPANDSWLWYDHIRVSGK